MDFQCPFEHDMAIALSLVGPAVFSDMFGVRTLSLFVKVLILKQFTYKVCSYVSIFAILRPDSVGAFRSVAIVTLLESSKLCVICTSIIFAFSSHLFYLISKGFWHPCRGARLGEALHPGPEFNIAITNPTAILNKQQHYHSLCGDYNLHAFAASETSATITAQSVTTSRFRSSQMRMLWSPPVLDQFQTVTDRPSLRGRAAGVCLGSIHPCRIALETITPDWQASCRILHTVVSIGSFDIQVIILYGLASGHSQASKTNSELVMQALQASNCLSLPAIILGDFNANPFQLECAATIQQQGFQDLAHLYRDLYGKAFPCTCKDATSPDTALISASLIPMLKSIQVHPDFLFDAHKPVILSFNIDAALFQRYHLHMPRSWLDLPIEQHLLATAYEEVVTTTGTPDTLESWGTTVEHAVDLAYRYSQQQHTQCHFDSTQPLPKAFRGRCQPAKLQAAPHRSLTKMGRPGDYNPNTEVYRFQTLRCIRQVRRVQSLRRRLNPNRAGRSQEGLQAEWFKICQDKSFGGCFVLWCQQQPEIGPLPKYLPSHDLLWTLEQLLRHHTDSQLAQDAAIWRRKQEYFRQLDGQHQGYSQAFSQIKAKPFATLHSIRNPVETEVSVVPDGCQATLFLEQGHHFRANHLALFQDVPCHVLSSHDDHLIIQADCDTDTWPSEGTLKQAIIHTHPTHIMSELTAFWQPLWQRPAVDPALENLQPFLECIPSDFPPASLDTKDPDVWIQAVKSLKPSSGRGVDAISAAELQSLPPAAIANLGEILSSYEQGFPSWLMLARTVPIPKSAGLVESANIRPITILAQTYRLWSRVVCQAILGHFAKHMPREITGLLRHRGPVEAAYLAQIQHEIALLSSQVEGGFSLDLVKCFNTIGQSQAVALLQHLGVPPDIIRVWHSSIQHMQRTWDLGREQSCAIPCTNGVPEGDTFSVVIMVCVAYGWICNVKRVAPAIRIGAYADNWGWATPDPNNHQSTFDVTVAYTGAIGMAIDWAKSWYWATNRMHQQQIVRAVSRHTTHPIKKVAFAQDLGCTMTYHGPPRLQSISKRFQEGKKRLKNLEALPHTITVKSHLAKAGILPVVLMGVEFVPVRPHVFQSFRTGLANAIMGFSQSRNSTMAINCMPKMSDPELEATLRSVRAFKKFLATATSGEVQSAITFLAKHDGHPQRCQGPIGTLKFYLRQLGWTVQTGGMIAVSAFVVLPIFTTSLSVFRFWAQRSWQEHLASFHSDRKAWQNLPAINLADTKRLISTFPDKHQLMLLNEISGSFQTAMQQRAWDPNIKGTCKHCGQDDTRYHRVYTCQATENVRLPFQTLLTDLEEHDSQWHELPVLFEHPSADYVATLHEKQVPTKCQETILHDLNALPYATHCYTDGSCHHPSSATTRFASFAIVVDTAPDDECRRYEAYRWMTTHQTPPTLVPLSLSRLPGKQDIHRAELYAAVQVCEGLRNVIIHTDSTYVLSVYQLCQGVTKPDLLSMQDNADLVIRLWHALQVGSHRFYKVKAHRDPASEDDTLSRYHLLGNMKANDLAIWTNLNIHPALVREYQSYHSEVDAMRNQLLEFFHLQVALNTTRAQMDAIQHTTTDPVPKQQRHTAVETLQNWGVTDVWVPPVIQMDISADALWGRTLTGLLQQWLKLFRWPANPAPDDYGVTWLELACSFWQFSGTLIPVKRADQTGTFRMIHVASYEAAAQFQVKFSEQAKNLSQWMDQVTDLVDKPVFPPYSRGLVRSLYTLGSGIQSSGIKVRPAFPFQAETVEKLHAHFGMVRSQAMIELPIFSLQPKVSADVVAKDLQLSWDQRSKVVHAGAKKVREWRKQPQRQLRF